MKRLAVLRILTPIYALVALATFSFSANGQDAKRLAGYWNGTSGSGGYVEVWKITITGKTCSVDGTYKEGKKRVGGFESNPCKVTGNNEIEFTQLLDEEMIKHANWKSGTIIKARLNPSFILQRRDTLDFDWTATNKNTGQVTGFKRGLP